MNSEYIARDNILHCVDNTYSILIQKINSYKDVYNASDMKDFLLNHINDIRRSLVEDNTAEEIIYILSAMIDEICMNIKWIGSDTWSDNLIEHALFGTNIAGDKIFKMIDLTLSNRGNPRIGLACLRIITYDFKGKYRIINEKQISVYKNKLYNFITFFYNDLKITNDKILFDNYTSVRNTEEAKFIIIANKWRIITIWACVSFLTFGIMWEVTIRI